MARIRAQDSNSMAVCSKSVLSTCHFLKLPLKVSEFQAVLCVNSQRALGVPKNARAEVV